MTRTCIVAAALLLSAARAHAQFGPLPGGSLLPIGYGGVHAELALGFLIHEDSVIPHLPEGVLPFNPPGADSMALVTFIVVAAESILVGERVAARDGRGLSYQAAWWVITQPTAAFADLNPVVNATSLEEWYSDPVAARDLAAVGVDAHAARIIMDSTGSVWSFEARHESGAVTGSCAVQGPTQPVPSSLPQYGVVHHTGARPVLNVLTFFGHLSAPCTATFEVTGTGPFHRWLRDAPPALRLPASFQPGWHAIGGIHPRP